MSEKKIETLSKEDLQRYKKHGYLTVGELKKFLENHEIADDAIVLCQRVEDFYFEDHGWKVYLKEGDQSHWMKSFNEKLANGEFDDKEKYPKFTDEMRVGFTQDQITEASNQYHPIWCPVQYQDEDKNDILFLDLHY